MRLWRVRNFVVIQSLTKYPCFRILHLNGIPYYAFECIPCSVFEIRYQNHGSDFHTSRQRCGRGVCGFLLLFRHQLTYMVPYAVSEWYSAPWGRVTHICVSKLTCIDSDNGLSPGRRQDIIWTNDGILLIRTLGTNFSEILSEIYSFSFNKMHLKMSSAKWRLFRLGLNELNGITYFVSEIQVLKSRRSFAHVTTAIPSWCVRNSLVIQSPINSYCIPTKKVCPCEFKMVLWYSLPIFKWIIRTWAAWDREWTAKYL